MCLRIDLDNDLERSRPTKVFIDNQSMVRVVMTIGGGTKCLLDNIGRRPNSQPPLVIISLW